MILIVLLGIGGWIAVGVPGKWIQPILSLKMDLPVEVDAAVVSFRPWSGLELTELKLYTKRDLVTPLFTADTLWVDADLWHRFKHGEWVGELEIDSGQLSTNLGSWAKDLVTDQEVDVDDLNVKFGYAGEILTIQNGSGELNHLDLDVVGAIDLSVYLKQGEPPPEETPVTPKRTPEQLIKDIAKSSAKIIGFLENFQFDDSPVVHVALSQVEEAQGKSLRVDLQVDHKGKGVHRGFVFQEIAVKAHYQNPHLVVEDFKVVENEQRMIQGQVNVDFEQKVYDVDVKNSLRRFGLEALAPFSLGHLLDWLQLRLEDRCDFTLQVGPNPFSKPGNKLSGHFYAENGFYRDAFFPQIELDLALDGSDLKLSNIVGRVGKGKGEGPVKGNVGLNFENHLILIDLEGSFYPDIAVSLLDGTSERLLREWECRGVPPEFNIYVYKENKGSELELKVKASGKDILWRGSYFNTVSAQVTYEKGVLDIWDARATRGKELLEGSLHFTKGFKGCRFDILSTFHLPDVVALIGPKVSKYMQSLHFKGDCKIAGHGFIDLSGQHQHDFTGTFSFQDLVYHWLGFNELSGSIMGDRDIIEIPDIKAAVEGGGMTASFRTRDTFSSDAKFDLILNLKDMDLFKVITQATDLEDTPYSGDLSFTVNLTGNIFDTPEDPRSLSYAGKGSINISEGTLFRIPLLLGLSNILSKVVSGFGYASQSDFSADFTVADGWVKSNNLFLEGKLLSIAGDGSYRFAGEKISADLKVQLFSGGILSDALKLLLWPIRKLIEVQLTGTIDDPSWQPKNLPKELFGK
ncbi:AsmA-like C-terminal region-containing protein [Kiritimatiellota bacterium B12222]|nr:AsmA-like C-terminal region-containing protein [Kiritimatiellota bacterium B12222]